jgi:very-short-patch-repair endonuclease
MIYIDMKTITLTCENCDKAFEKPLKEYTRWVKRGRNKFYCCQECVSIGTLITCKEIDRECLWCKKLFKSTTHKTHKKCCSRNCASHHSHSYVDTKKLSNKMKRLFREGKIISKKKSNIEDRKCCICEITFKIPVWEKRKTCSKGCNTKLARKISTKRYIDRVQNGTWTTWRKRAEPSYPEKFFMKVLENNDIPYEYEFPIKQYSIDFAIHGKKIALEIDGQQHRLEERQKSDKNKDDVLKSNGWNVYRIKWDGDHTNSRKEYLKEEIDKFVSFYNTI